ncbi:MAG TPA: transaldolase [Anaerolineae bacterium]
MKDGRPHPPASLDELQILPGVAEALGTLKRAGFLLIGVTNQPDVARGTQERRVVEDINQALSAALPLDEIRVCYHDDRDGCNCRKPLPGLITKAALELDIDLPTSFMIGDRWKDIQAGRHAGCKNILIGWDYAEEWKGSLPDLRTRTLWEAAGWILERDKRQSPMKSLSELKVKIFADGANISGMLEMYQNPLIKGFTTNPTLMRNAGVVDYQEFATQVVQAITDRPISFEVLSDDFDEMKRQAIKLASWGSNVYVKIPVTNTQGKSSIELIRDLARAGIKQNVTALTMLDQVRDVGVALAGGPSAFVSVFAGRIADTGHDPMPLMAAAVELLSIYPNVELIWASPRELLNLFQADAVGCQIITVTNDILRKLSLAGKDLRDFSLDTVKMFHNDAVKAGYTL